MRVVLLVVLLTGAGNVLAASEADALVARGIQATMESQVPGDKSTAARLFAEAIDVDPNHLEAHWQLLWIDMGGLVDQSLSHRVSALPAATEKFRTFEALVIAQNEEAFLHYVRAQFASLYGAHERAIHEIDQALASEPNSIRYLFRKADLLYVWGRFDNNERLIGDSQRLFLDVLARYDDAPSPLVSKSHAYFVLAQMEREKTSPDLEQAIVFEQQGLETEKNTRSIMYAWQRLSIAYRMAGRCAEALTAAENALKLADFKAARDQKLYAEFCLEGER